MISGEAELYALNKAASEALGIQAVAADLGIQLAITIKVDTLATIGMITRSEIGKLRHLEVSELWLQEAIRKGRFTVLRVDGAKNTADIVTKHVPAETLDRYMKESGVKFYT